jgi:hypothetical protein
MQASTMADVPQDPALRRLIDQNRSAISKAHEAVAAARRCQEASGRVIAETRLLVDRCRANLRR